jgi:hypothetical protein
MTAVLFVTAAFVVGLFGGALVSAARDYGVEQAEDDAYRDELVRQWREGYAHGFTTGRVQLVGEQQARRMHPTGSPESVLKAIDAEADRRMKGGD